MSVFARTMHPDEANQAFTLGKLLEQGEYRYSPSDHHGPTLYYAAVPVVRAAGAKDFASLESTPLRCTPLIFGVMTVILSWLAFRRITATWQKDRIPTSVIAPLALATLPILFFYATDFIQETLLGCFLMGMFWSAVEFAQPRRSPLRGGTFAALFGMFAGLSAATKETAVISFAAAAIAVPPTWRFAELRQLKITKREIGVGIAAAVITVLALFSSFFTNLHGLYDAFIAAPLSYLGRAVGDASSEGAAAHVHAWWWYFTVQPGVLTRFGLLCLMAALCLGWRRAPKPGRFLALYTVLSLAFYSSIPYKTPWCMLTVFEGLMMAAGAMIFGRPTPKTRREINEEKGSWLDLSRTLLTMATPPLYLLFVFLNVQQCCKINENPDSRRLPFNYAAASWDVKNAGELAERLVAGKPDAYIAVCVPSDDLWPLPWYLRKAKVGYWERLEDMPAADLPPVAVITPADESSERAAKRFPEKKNAGMYGVRPGVLINVLY